MSTNESKEEKGVFLAEERAGVVVKESLNKHSRDCKKPRLPRTGKARAKVVRE